MAGVAVKLSITVPPELVAALRLRAGSRGVSSFVSRAIAHELEREQLGAYLIQPGHGPVPEDVLEEARRAWRRR